MSLETISNAKTTPAGNANSDPGTAAIPGRNIERKLFVGGLARETTEKDLREYFQKFGGVESVSLKMDTTTGQSRGFAFILFSDIQAVDRVLFSSHVIHARKVDVRQVTKRAGKVFVGGLNPAITDEDIRNHFSQYGTVIEIQTPYDKERNQRKPFCFVTFDDNAVVHKVLQNPKQYIKGKEVDVKTVKQNQDAAASKASPSMPRLNMPPNVPGLGMNPLYAGPMGVAVIYGDGLPKMGPNVPFEPKSKGLPRQCQRHQPY